MRHAKWPYFKDINIYIPKNHKKLAKIIKQMNEWEKIVNQTTKQMNKYIDGVLQFSLGGKNE